MSNKLEPKKMIAWPRAYNIGHFKGKLFDNKDASARDFD